MGLKKLIMLNSSYLQFFSFPAVELRYYFQDAFCQMQSSAKHKITNNNFQFTT